MNRDKALRKALINSKQDDEIYVLWQTEDEAWHFNAYCTLQDRDSLRVSSTRYILPGGEITKLS